MPPPEPFPLIHTATLASQAVLSTYALYLSLRASILMNRYTSPAEQAAKISKRAGNELQLTRKTLACAVGASLVSLAGGALPMLPYQSTQQPIGGASSLGSAALAAVVLVGARRYVMGYWDGKIDVPGVGGHNEALRCVRTLSVVMRWTVLVISAGGALDVLGTVVGR